MNRRFRRLHGIMLIVDRGGGASEVIDFVDLDIERKCHIVANKLKMWMPMKMIQITFRACEQIIDAQYLVSLLQ